MSEPRQVARQRGRANADEADVAVVQRTRSGHSHHFGGRVFHMPLHFIFHIPDFGSVSKSKIYD
jgi:hypothetical protein